MGLARSLPKAPEHEKQISLRVAISKPMTGRMQYHFVKLLMLHSHVSMVRCQKYVRSVIHPRLIDCGDILAYHRIVPWEQDVLQTLNSRRQGYNALGDHGEINPSYQSSTFGGIKLCLCNVVALRVAGWRNTPFQHRRLKIARVELRKRRPRWHVHFRIVNFVQPEL